MIASRNESSIGRPTPIGVALLGYDGAGTQNHQLDMYEPAFAANPAYALRCVTDHEGVSDARRAVSLRAAERLGVAYVPNLDDALARDDVEAASVCVHFRDRVDAVERAALHGVDVLVDKPMALRLEDIDRMAAAAEAAGTRCVPANHIRYHPAVTAIRSTIGAGRIGALSSLHADFIVTTGATRVSAQNPRPWPLGELMNFLTYPVDVIRSVTDQEVTRVHATRGGYFYGGNDDEDLGVVTLMLEGGATATLIVCRAPLTGHISAGTHRYRVMGTDGMVLVDLKRPFGLLHSANPTKSIVMAHEWNSVDLMLSDLANALRSGHAPDLGPADARAALEVTLAARRSADEGRTVALVGNGRRSEGGSST